MLLALVLAVVLLAAALHAGWNVVVLAGSDRRRGEAGEAIGCASRAQRTPRGAGWCGSAGIAAGAAMLRLAV